MILGGSGSGSGSGSGAFSTAGAGVFASGCGFSRVCSSGEDSTAAGSLSPASPPFSDIKQASTTPASTEIAAYIGMLSSPAVPPRVRVVVRTVDIGTEVCAVDFGTPEVDVLAARVGDFVGAGAGAGAGVRTLVGDGVAGTEHDK